MMLGTVKMEGHETSDWNSYYTDTQEVSDSEEGRVAEREGEGGRAASWGITLRSRSCQCKRVFFQH